MIEMVCPQCGRTGVAPKEKINSRLNCKKCHAIFYLTESGRSVLGEPPGAHHDPHGHGTGHALAESHAHGSHATHPASRQNDEYDAGRAILSWVPVGLIGLVAVASATYYFWPVRDDTSNLAAKAHLVAQSIAADKLAAIQPLAAEDGKSDLGTWYERFRPIVDEMRRDSGAGEVACSFLVTEENRETRTGEATLFFVPKLGNERTEAIARAASTKPLARKTLDVPTRWTFDNSGNWRLDVRRTAMAANSVH